MGNKKIKNLKAKLLVAIKKVLLQDNKAELTDKSEKSIKKSIKRILTKSDKRKSVVATKRAKIKMDGISIV